MAQPFLEEPNRGLELPTVGLSGEFDATSVVTNPAGMSHLGAGHLGMALNLGDRDDATYGGQGFGMYWATRLFGSVSYGMAFEWVRSSRSNLTPDVGTPFKLTSSLAFKTGKRSSIGVSWQRFFDDGNLGGNSAWDVGYTNRFNAAFSLGAVVRNLNPQSVSGIEGQRTYDVEATFRPIKTDGLELSLGTSIGEKRAAVEDAQGIDFWIRGSVQLIRGIYLKAVSYTHLTLPTTPYV